MKIKSLGLREVGPLNRGCAEILYFIFLCLHYSLGSGPQGIGRQ